MGVDRVGLLELLVEVPGEHLDVAGLVHHLGGGVVLGVDPRHGLDDLGGAQQRALLAVEELALGPHVGLDGVLQPLLLAPLLERRAGEVHAHGGEVLAAGDPDLAGDPLGVDLGVPRQVGGAVPLAGLGLLVQLDEGRTGALVVPGEQGVGVVLDRVDDLVDVGVGHGEDGVEVVDVLAAEDVGVGTSHGARLSGVDGGYSR